jgi:hypothetical protein
MDRLLHCYGTGVWPTSVKKKGHKQTCDGRTDELQIRYKSPTKTPKSCSSGSTLGVFLLWWWWCAATAAAAAMSDPRQTSIATSVVIFANLFCHFQARSYVPQRIIDHSRFRAWWAPPAPLDRLHECVAIGSWTHAVPDGRTDGRTAGPTAYFASDLPAGLQSCIHLSIFLATHFNHV